MRERDKDSIGKIEINPKVLGGKPIIADTRISVEQILEFLANEWNIKKILTQFPLLDKADIKAAVSYAAKRVKNEEIHIRGGRDRLKRHYVAA